MTKRDFEFLSRTFMLAKFKLSESDAYVYGLIVREFASALREAAGPKFDRDRFLVDCGLNP